MTARLDPYLPYRLDEDPVGYASRLARLCERGFPQFLADMRLDRRGLFAGRSDALEGLAALTGTPVALLTENAALPSAKGFVDFRGHRLRTRTTARFACPACLADDLSSGDGPLACRPYARAIWRLRSLRTCRVHDLSLVEVAREDVRCAKQDFSVLIEPAMHRLPALVAQAVPREPGRLEDHILGRLEGEEPPSWLADTPTWALVASCEVLGAAATFGPGHGAGNLTADDCHAAGAAGFEVLSDPASLDRFLRDLQATRGRGKRSRGLGRWLGKPAAGWLQQVAADPALRQIRDALFDYLTANTPVDAGDVVLGRPVGRRRLHSVRTASVRYGIALGTLRAALVQTGRIPPDRRDGAGGLATFDVDEAHAYLERLSTAVNLNELRALVGASSRQVRALLRAGFFRPLIPESGKEALRRIYPRDEIDTFVSDVLARVRPCDVVPDGAVTLSKAAHGNAAGPDILRLFLAGRITWLGSLDPGQGYGALLVRAEEVAAACRGPELQGLMVRQARKRLRINSTALRRLVEEGCLPTTEQVHPATGRPLRIVSETDLARSHETYVTLFVAAEALDAQPVLLRDALRARGVTPAWDPKAIRATLYRRADVPQDRSAYAAFTGRKGLGRFSGPSRTVNPLRRLRRGPGPVI